jgi:mannose-6-phosphate isomerase class I
MILVDKTKAYNSPVNRSIEIILCVDGRAFITDMGNNTSINLEMGKSVVIPACVRNYTINGKATLYKASVPV